MSFSLRSVMAAALVATLLSAPAMALEKTAAPFDGDRDAWQRGTDCTITYYNICTGWIWIWSGWSPGDQFGVSFTSCCAGGNESSVVGSWIYFGTGSPAGYGFTGIAVALMGRNHPVGIFFAALLFGVLYQGGAELAFEIPAITRDMVVVIQGLVILFCGALENLFRRPIEGYFQRRALLVQATAAGGR